MPPLRDARSLKSQQALRQALIDLLAEMAFEQISLRDIAQKAKVSYPTFYRHFSSKDDLLADIARQESQGFLLMHPEPLDEGPGSRIVAFVAKRRDLWRVLLSPGASAIMREQFIREGQAFANQGPRLNPRFPVTISSRIFASGLFEIIAWWFSQPEDYPEKEIAEMLETFVINPVIGRMPD
ncbi:MAG TPA: TetR/AcrR family transcriptional regulator [Sphingobium sp.]|uniref:TetR/AcrR family transcriptional regulator n=1 Tax=Sphingobium sp. TaxID=1912891 RepID=UPI002ED17B42